FALVGAPYLGFPRTFGSYLSPAVLVLLVWAARTLAADGERRLPRRAWVAVAVGMSIWLAVGATFSLRTGRSVLWTVVFAVTLPLVGVAAGSSGDLGRDALIRAWTLLAIAMGALATGEGLTRWNPLAAHFRVDGEPIVQKWSVYRVETTMGHPL